MFLLNNVMEFLWRDFCLYKLFLISENKSTEHLIPPNAIKVYEDFLEINMEQAENTKSVERQTTFPNKYAENTDLCKPVLNKIMSNNV